MVDVGERLKRVREMHGLTQRALAEKTKISHSMISLIEHKRTSPSVGVLNNILDVIPISLSKFFSEQHPATVEDFHVPAQELTELASGPITLRQVGRDLSKRALQIMHERFEPGADTGTSLLRHEGEEGGIVIVGTIELIVGGKARTLRAGDAYYFDSRLKHRFRNTSNQVAEIVSVCTPPTF